jgi:hypothetical protein
MALTILDFLNENICTNFNKGKLKIRKKLKPYPKIVKKNGIFLITGLKNSASSIVASKATKTEL